MRCSQIAVTDLALRTGTDMASPSHPATRPPGSARTPSADGAYPAAHARSRTWQRRLNVAVSERRGVAVGGPPRHAFRIQLAPLAGRRKPDVARGRGIAGPSTVSRETAFARRGPPPPRRSTYRARERSARHRRTLSARRRSSCACDGRRARGPHRRGDRRPLAAARPHPVPPGPSAGRCCRRRRPRQPRRGELR